MMALKKPQAKSVLQKSTTKSEVRRENEAKRLLEYMREEYDEFEEFIKEEQEKCPEKISSMKLGNVAWEENWGDDFLEDDFHNVL
uniref:26S proteasome complex subunit dss-1 n=1 Tax=Romanomermis culicivorax TaxID=13658 RepID=A0A915JNK8_ROMCU